MTELHSPRGLFTAEPYSGDTLLPVTVRAERIYITGRPGTPWSITIGNETGGRLLVRVAVDGKNVLRDEPYSATSGDGYVLPPHGSYPLRGWRTSDDEVREFVFTGRGESAGLPGRQGFIVFAAMPERPRETYLYTTNYSGERDSPRVTAVAAAAPSDLGTGTGEYRYDPASRTDFDPEPGDPDILVIRYGSPAWLRLQEDDSGYGRYETATYSARALSRDRHAPRQPGRLRRLGRTGH